MENQREGYGWSAKEWKQEIETLAREMWLGNKLARTVGILSIDSFGADRRPINLATAAATLKFLKYKIWMETGHPSKSKNLSQPFRGEAN